MRRQYKGNSKPTILAAGIQVGDASLTLLDGTNYPDGTTGQFVLTVDLGQAGEEKVLATSRAGNSVTGLTRGFDGTVAGAHSSGAPIAHTLSALDIDEANRHVNQTGLTDDPHPQYQNKSESDLLYTPVDHVTATDPHTQYLTAARGDALFLTPAEGAAAYAPISLVAAPDPYPQYTTVTEVGALYTTRTAFLALPSPAPGYTGTQNIDVGTLTLTLPTAALVTVKSNAIYVARAGSAAGSYIRHTISEKLGAGASTRVATDSQQINTTIDRGMDVNAVHATVLVAGVYVWTLNLAVVGSCTIDAFADATHHYFKVVALCVPDASKL